MLIILILVFLFIYEFAQKSFLLTFMLNITLKKGGKRRLISYQIRAVNFSFTTWQKPNFLPSLQVSITNHPSAKIYNFYIEEIILCKKKVCVCVCVYLTERQ